MFSLSVVIIETYVFKQFNYRDLFNISFSLIYTLPPESSQQPIFQNVTLSSRKLTFQDISTYSIWARNSQIQVDPDAIIDSLKGMHMSEAGQKHVHTHGGTHHITPYSTRYASKQEISKFRIPDKGAPADAVHQMLKDELDLDGRPNLNLARYGVYPT